MCCLKMYRYTRSLPLSSTKKDAGVENYSGSRFNANILKYMAPYLTCKSFVNSVSCVTKDKGQTQRQNTCAASEAIPVPAQGCGKQLRNKS